MPVKPGIEQLGHAVGWLLLLPQPLLIRGRQPRPLSGRQVGRPELGIVAVRGTVRIGRDRARAQIVALLRNPRVLVLDDALSSVDTHTEDKILNHLRDVMHGRTTIFISHRVSTVRNADRIAVLHQGRIVELGTHDELLARNGYYTDLYNKQLLEEELAEV